ncbi:MAG: SemiSWEET family transporter [Cyclobacteriaceae bacterium]
MDWIQIAGHTGAFLSAITFAPQVYKAWKTKSVGDLSMAMILIVFTSTIVWLIYAFALNLWPVIIANTVICILVVVLILFKMTFKKS